MDFFIHAIRGTVVPRPPRRRRAKSPALQTKANGIQTRDGGFPLDAGPGHCRPSMGWPFCSRCHRRRAGFCHRRAGIPLPAEDGSVRTFSPCVGAACMRPAHVMDGTRSRSYLPIPLQCRAGVHARRRTFVMVRNVPGNVNAPGRHTCRPYDHPFCSSQNRKRDLTVRPDRRGQDPALRGNGFFHPCHPGNGRSPATPSAAGEIARPTNRRKRHTNPRWGSPLDVGAGHCLPPTLWTVPAPGRISPSRYNVGRAFTPAAGRLSWSGTCRATLTPPGGIHAAPTTIHFVHHKTVNGI